MIKWCLHISLGKQSETFFVPPCSLNSIHLILRERNDARPQHSFVTNLISIGKCCARQYETEIVVENAVHDIRKVTVVENAVHDIRKVTVVENAVHDIRKVTVVENAVHGIRKSHSSGKCCARH